MTTTKMTMTNLLELMKKGEKESHIHPNKRTYWKELKYIGYADSVDGVREGRAYIRQEGFGIVVIYQEFPEKNLHTREVNTRKPVNGEEWLIQGAIITDDNGTHLTSEEIASELNDSAPVIFQCIDYEEEDGFFNI